MTTRPTDFAQASEADHPQLGRMHRAAPSNPFPWRGDRGMWRSDDDMAFEGARIIPITPTIPEWGDIPEDVQEQMVGLAWGEFCDGDPSDVDTMRRALAAALTSPPTRPEWADLEDVLKAGWPDGVNGAQNSHIARALHEAGVRVPEVGQ